MPKWRILRSHIVIIDSAAKLIMRRLVSLSVLSHISMDAAECSPVQALLLIDLRLWAALNLDMIATHFNWHPYSWNSLVQIFLVKILMNFTLCIQILVRCSPCSKHFLILVILADQLLESIIELLLWGYIAWGLSLVFSRVGSAFIWFKECMLKS